MMSALSSEATVRGVETLPPVGKAVRTDGPPRRRAQASPNLIAMAGVLVFYAAIGLFIYADCFNIGKMKNVEETDAVTIAGISPRDIALVLVLGFTLVSNEPFRRLLLSRGSLCFLTFLGCYSFLGLALGNEFNWLREDLRIWAWMAGGVAMFQMLLQFRRPCLHLLMLCLVASTVLFLSAWSGKNAMNNDAFLGNDRLWDMNVFNYSGMTLILLGLVLCLCTLKSPFYVAGSAAALGMYFYAGIIVGATRSIALTLVLVCTLAAPCLMFERDRSRITRRIGGSAVLVGATLLMAAGLVLATFMGFAFSGSTVLADRLTNSNDIDSGLDRLVELGDAFRQLGPLRTMIGGGLGHVFESIFNYQALSPHICVFVFLFKFGLLPFLAIIGFLYLVLPFKFLQGLVAPRTLSPNMRTALLIALPGVLGWTLVLAMSGGYSAYYSIGLGLSLGAFMEVRQMGLWRICR